MTQRPDEPTQETDPLIMSASPEIAFVKTWRQLIRMPSRSSPSGGEEGKLQQHVAAQMRKCGARVRTFEADNVPGFRSHPLCHGPNRSYADRPTVLGEIGPEDAPALLVVAHSDTVQLDCTRPASEWTVDPFAGLLRDNAVWGLGAGDDKWGVASMLAILDRLQDANLSRRIIFGSTIDEEHGVGNGMLLLMLAGVKAEACLYLDGGEAHVAIAKLGGSNLYLHPRGGMDPIRFRDDARKLETACRELSLARADLFDRPFFEGHHQREKSVLLSPQRGSEEPFHRIAFYTLEGEKAEEVCAALEAMVGATLGDRMTLYRLTYRRPWFEPQFVDPNAVPARLLSDAYTEVTGKPAMIRAATKQDSFVLNNHAGIPTVSFGAGRFTGYGCYHSPDEHVDIDLGWECCRVAHGAVTKWLAGGKI